MSTSTRCASAEINRPTSLWPIPALTRVYGSSSSLIPFDDSAKLASTQLTAIESLDGLPDHISSSQ